MFQNARKNYTPFVFQKKAILCYLVSCASLVETLELSNANKGNLLEFVYSVGWELHPSIFNVLGTPWRRPIQCYLPPKTCKGLSLYFWKQLAGNFPAKLFLIQSYFQLIFFSWKCLLSVENSGGYLKISAEISVNHVQFCRPKLENLCEEYLKPAVVVSTGRIPHFSWGMLLLKKICPCSTRIMPR